MLHAHGATLLEAAEAIFARTKYGRVRDLRLALPRAWGALGLPYRSIPDAQVLRFTREPHPWARLDITPEDARDAMERAGGNRNAAARELGVAPRTISNRLRVLA